MTLVCLPFGVTLVALPFGMTFMGLPLHLRRSFVGLPLGMAFVRLPLHLGIAVSRSCFVRRCLKHAIARGHRPSTPSFARAECDAN
jgi:hypothetical protein